MGKTKSGNGRTTHSWQKSKRDSKAVSEALFVISRYQLLPKTIPKHLKCKRIFSDALFQCIGKLNDIIRYLFQQIS